MPPQEIYSIITTESVKDLELGPNKQVLALIKSTEVLVSRGEEGFL
ncbi:MAG: TOBE domain-containing protein [Candidatus Helarchaeota archaeon]